MSEDLHGKELWTQGEVAEYLRVVPGTVLNWRRQGLLRYFQAPGSRRVLFYRDDVLRFRDDHTSQPKGGGAKPKPIPTKKKPDISTTPAKKWEV